jgi:hypothetical protein
LPATALVLSGATQATAGARTPAAAPASAVAKSSDVVGLTDNDRLVKFRSTSPGKIRRTARVVGLQRDQRLVGIDYRVQNGKLYGVGDRGGVYTLNTAGTFGRATKVSQLTVPLAGQNFGVDFNPAANRLRVISDTGQNLRHNLDDPAGTPAAGTTATDSTLAYPGTPPTTATQVTAAAYTNNDVDPNTATTLFDIDAMLDQVVIQSPANAGLLTPTGKLTVDAGQWAGFDISSRGGLAVLNTAGRMRLYNINLTTGKATRLGTFPRNTQPIDLAIPLPR